MIKGKQHFVEGESVIMYGIDDTGREWDVVVCGKQDMVLLDNYIVKLPQCNDFRDNYPFSCVSIIESCLKRK